MSDEPVAAGARPYPGNGLVGMHHNPGVKGGPKVLDL